MVENSRYYQEWWRLAEIKPNSRKVITSDLRKFNAFLETQYNVTLETVDFDRFYVDSATGRNYPMDRQLARNYVKWIEQKHPNSPSTRISAITSIRGFLRVLQKNRVVSNNPFDGLVYKTNPRPRRTVVLTDVETQRILDEAVAQNPATLREAAMYLALVHAGLRNSELRSLQWKDVDLRNKVIFLTSGTKGDKERITPISDTLDKALTTFCDSQPHDPSDLVFLQKGRQLTSLELIRFVKQIVEAAGVSKPVTPHVLRHTWVTNLYRRGVPLEIIAEISGHASGVTTFGYIHLTPQQRREILESQRVTSVIEECFASLLLDKLPSS